MSAIYNPDTDEITTQRTEGAVGETSTTSPSASTSEIGGGPQGEGGNNTLPGVQSQIDNLNAQRKAELDHIDTNYNQFLEQYDTEGNAIEALSSTVKKRKVIDPEQMRIRRNIANLYDALQLTGSLAGMAAGGRGTIGTPAQLSSAAAAHNTLAQRLQEQQRQADQDYTTQLANMTHRQQTARANLNKQRAQATANYDKQRAAINKHYDNLETKIIEGERKRQHNMATTILRENNKQQLAYQRQYGKTSTDKSSELFYEGNWYKLPKNREKGFMGEVAQLSDRIGINLYYLSKTNNVKGLPLYTGAILSILNGTVKEVEITPEVYQEALDIFNTYLSPLTHTPKAKTNTTTTSSADDFSQYMVSDDSADDFSQYKIN